MPKRVRPIYARSNQPVFLQRNLSLGKWTAETPPPTRPLTPTESGQDYLRDLFANIPKIFGHLVDNFPFLRVNGDQPVKKVVIPKNTIRKNTIAPVLGYTPIRKK